MLERRQPVMMVKGPKGTELVSLEGVGDYFYYNRGGGSSSMCVLQMCALE